MCCKFFCDCFEYLFDTCYIQPTHSLVMEMYYTDKEMTA